MIQECEKSVATCWSRLKTSIHPFSIPSLRRSGRGGAGAYPSSHRGKGGVHPGQVASPSQGHIDEKRDKQPHTLTLTPKDNLKSPVNLTCMFLAGGRKPEYPERTRLKTYQSYFPPRVGRYLRRTR